MRRTVGVFAFLLSLLFAVPSYAQDPVSFSFSTIDVPTSLTPGANNTKAFSISGRGNIVGRYFDSAGQPHGFLLSASGTFTAPIDVPVTNTGTVLRGINSPGDMSGRFFDSGGLSHGFLINAGGGFTQTDFPGAIETVAERINNVGEIAGHFTAQTAVTGCSGTLPLTHGFWRHPDGSFTQIDFPGALMTFAKGINDQGEIAGLYIVLTGQFDCSHPLATSITIHGFVRSPKGVFSTVDAPASSGATSTGINAINEAGDVIGAYTSNALIIADFADAEFKVSGHGFFLSGNATAFALLDDPNGGTFPLGINASRKVVGFYADSSGNEHGFLAMRQP